MFRLAFVADLRAKPPYITFKNGASFAFFEPNIGAYRVVCTFDYICCDCGVGGSVFSSGDVWESDVVFRCRCGMSSLRVEGLIVT